MFPLATFVAQAGSFAAQSGSPSGHFETCVASQLASIATQPVPFEAEDFEPFVALLVVELCPCCSAAVSYTHLTLPTKRIV